MHDLNYRIIQQKQLLVTCVDKGSIAFSGNETGYFLLAFSCSVYVKNFDKVSNFELNNNIKEESSYCCQEMQEWQLWLRSKNNLENHGWNKQ